MSTPTAVLLNVRLWRMVDSSGGPDACWPWTGSRNPKGYGRINCGRVNGVQRNSLAHRLAYEIGRVEQVPPGLIVMHTCDNPPCCNPAHLRIGTNAENTADMIAKGRHRSADLKLTDAQIAEIRSRAASGEMLKSLAIEFGVSRSYLSEVNRGLKRRSATDRTAVYPASMFRRPR